MLLVAQQPVKQGSIKYPHQLSRTTASGRYSVFACEKFRREHEEKKCVCFFFFFSFNYLTVHGKSSMNHTHQELQHSHIAALSPPSTCKLRDVSNKL